MAWKHEGHSHRHVDAGLSGMHNFRTHPYDPLSFRDDPRRVTVRQVPGSASPVGECLCFPILITMVSGSDMPSSPANLATLQTVSS